MFEGAPVKIPYKFRDVLEAEYGAKALVNRDYHEYAQPTDMHCAVIDVNTL